MTDEKKKKGFLAAIWESISRPGGCCGSAEACCGPAQPEKKDEPAEKKEDTGSDTCCKDTKDQV